MCVLAATAQSPYDPLHPEREQQFSVATGPFDFFDKSQALPIYFEEGMKVAIDPGIKLEMDGKLCLITSLLKPSPQIADRVRCSGWTKGTP